MDQLWTWVTGNAAALGVVIAAAGVIIAFFAWRWPRRTDTPPGGDEIVHGPKAGGDVGGDLVGRDKTAGRDQVGRDKIQGHSITAETVFIQQSVEATSKVAVAAVAARFQLPARNPDFLGRRQKIEEIKVALQASGAQVIALEGMGGIGKTDTAVEAAHDLVVEGLLKDAQLFLDLQGFSAAAEPLSAADALRALLQSLVDTSDTLPESEHNLAARFREATRGLEILLFLDNARDEAQVRPLLPGHPGCKVLITCRNRLSLHGLRPVDLAAMDPAEATGLALRLANRRNPARIERAQAEKLARLCGQLPLAIEVTANALSVSAGASVDGYLEKLDQRAKPLAALDRVKATLQLSLETLDDETRDRWSALGVIPSPFDRVAAKSVWRIEEPARTLEVLEQRSLITHNENADSYHLHDVLQALALDELSKIPTKKERLFQRYFDYITDLFDGTAPLESLGTETLRFAQATFEDQLDKCTSTLLRRWLACYLWIFGPASVKRRLAYRFWSLGLVYRERGISTTALHQFERAVAISTEIRDRRSIALYSKDLAEALLWDEDPNPKRALEIIELGMAQNVRGFEHMHAWSMLKLGDYYFWRRSCIDEAEMAFNRALAMNVTPLAKAYCLRMLGRIHINRGRQEKAVEYLERSLAIYRTIDIGGGDVPFYRKPTSSGRCELRARGGSVGLVRPTGTRPLEPGGPLDYAAARTI